MKNVKNLMWMAAAVLLTVPAFGQEGVVAQGGVSDLQAILQTIEGIGGWLVLGAGLAAAIAVFGGTMGQGRAVSAALEGIARNPAAQGKMMGPMIIGLALIESLVILAWLIAFFFYGVLNNALAPIIQHAQTLIGG